jgi:hypothetical protein
MTRWTWASSLPLIVVLSSCFTATFDLRHRDLIASRGADVERLMPTSLLHLAAVPARQPGITFPKPVALSSAGVDWSPPMENDEIDYSP